MTTRDLRAYFTAIANKEKNAYNGSDISVSQFVKVAGNVNAAEASAVNAELETFSKKKRHGSPYNTIISARIKEEFGKYAHSYGTQAAIKRFKQKYPQTLFFVDYKLLET